MKKKSLKELVDYYERMLAIMPGNLYWKNANGVLQGCNINLAKTLHLNSPEDIVGMVDSDIATPEEAERIRKIDLEVMKNKVEQINEEKYTLPNGSTAYYLTQRTPIINNNEVIGLIGVSFDISDRKKMEEELRIAKEIAEAAKFKMTEFISNMGHDMATPISDVGIIAEILSMLLKDYPETKELLDTAKKRAADAEFVRKTILSGLSVSNWELTYETFSTISEILKLESFFKPTLIAKNLKLNIHPCSLKEDFIETDRKKFYDILKELINNAINFTKNGHITITGVKENGWFKISITDTGIGIPADKFGFIFEPYTKLARSNKYGATFKGAGTGLYLVQTLVNLLGGTISVESEVGKGSTFTFSLPVSFPRK